MKHVGSQLKKKTIYCVSRCYMVFLDLSFAALAGSGEINRITFPTTRMRSAIHHKDRARRFIFLFRGALTIMRLTFAYLVSFFAYSNAFAVSQGPVFAQRSLALSMASSPPAMKKADFVAAVAEKTGLSKKDADTLLGAVLETIQETVNEGNKLTLPGFGSFQLKTRAARKGRNPQTGEEIQIKESKNPSFTPAKPWKDTINGRK